MLLTLGQKACGQSPNLKLKLYATPFTARFSISPTNGIIDLTLLDLP